MEYLLCSGLVFVVLVYYFAWAMCAAAARGDRMSEAALRREEK